MTVSSTNNKNRHEGNAVTDTFAFVGRIFSSDDLVVQIITRATDVAVETLSSDDYTVTITGDESASIQVDAGKIPTALQDILIFRSVTQSQTLDLPTGTRFPAKAVEDGLDKVVTIVQDLKERLDRTVTVPITSSATLPTIGTITADTLLQVDDTGLIIESSSVSAADLATVSGISADITVVAGISSNVTVVAGNEADISTVATNIVDVQNAEDNANAAISSASDASDSATYAEEWAINPEDTPVSVAAGGNNSTTFSALHWAAKAADSVGGTTIAATKIDTLITGIGTGGNLITFDADGDPAFVATGSVGQVLTSNGAGSAPTMQNLAPTGFTTGDAKLTLKTTADTGWIMMDDGAIGNASSGASTRANADTEDLYTLLWNNVTDTYAAVSSGRGASAAADYAANKTIALTKQLGRALGVSGSGATLSARTLGQTTGTETHALTTAELASHSHGISTDTSGSHSSVSGQWSAGEGDNGTANTDSAGSGVAHPNMQPTVFWNVMLKL